MFAMSAPGIQIVSLWSHNVADYQPQAVVFFGIQFFVNDGMVVWAFSSAEVIDNSVCQEDFIINRDHVIPSRLVSPCYKFIFFNPFQPTGMLIGEFQKLLQSPNGRKLLVDPRHRNTQ